MTKPVRKRIAILLAAIAVPAMAAPGDFGAIAGGAPTEAEAFNAQLVEEMAKNPPMSFERPGMSFPGSAFYFLADPPADALIALPTTDASQPGAEGGRELGAIIDAGPSARPFFAASGTSHLRASQCLAQAVWYEAASEGEGGQRAVAQVVLNRVAHPSWPDSVCGVVYQGSQRSTGCQFTFTCDGSLARHPGGATWGRAQRVAEQALSGSVYAPIGHATHYHTLWVNPYWASSLDVVGTVGAHRFYRNRGAAGRKEAFTERYAGFEPGVTGRTAAISTGNTPAYTATPDLPVAPGGDATSQPVAPIAAATPASNTARAARYVPPPVLADPSLSGAGQVRDDYSRAGRWKDETAHKALEKDKAALALEKATNPASAQK